MVVCAFVPFVHVLPGPFAPHLRYTFVLRTRIDIRPIPTPPPHCGLLLPRHAFCTAHTLPVCLPVWTRRADRFTAPFRCRLLPTTVWHAPFRAFLPAHRCRVCISALVTHLPLPLTYVLITFCTHAAHRFLCAFAHVPHRLLPAFDSPFAFLPFSRRCHALRCTFGVAGRFCCRHVSLIDRCVYVYAPLRYWVHRWSLLPAVAHCDRLYFCLYLLHTPHLHYARRLVAFTPLRLCTLLPRIP